MRDFNRTDNFTVFGGFYPAEAHSGNPVFPETGATSASFETIQTLHKSELLRSRRGEGLARLGGASA
jgi:hypothetical protein